MSDSSEEIERSLRDIWSKALPRLRPNKANQLLSWSGLVLGIVPLFFGPINNFSASLAGFLDLLIQVVGGILGFVITGFVLAVTVVDRDMVKNMWRERDAYSKFPIYKVHVLEFIRPIIYLLVELFVILSASVFVHFIWPAIAPSMTSVALQRLRLWLQAIALGVVGIVISSSLIRLKAFGYNIYQYALLQVRYWDSQDEE